MDEEYAQPPDDVIPQDTAKRVLWHLKGYCELQKHNHDDIAGLDKGIYTGQVKDLIELVEILDVS